MNLLSSIVVSILAADTKKGDKGPPWFGEGGVFEWWQIILFFVLIGLVVFYWLYKKKQRENQ